MFCVVKEIKMVREVKEVTSKDDFEYPSLAEEFGGALAEPLERRATPLTRKVMVGMFEKWVVHTPRGSFKKVLEGWIAAQLEYRGHVNPEEEPFAVNVEQLTKAFIAELEAAFKGVRGSQLKEPKEPEDSKKKRTR
jgi:hypothetical protein